MQKDKEGLSPRRTPMLTKVRKQECPLDTEVRRQNVFTAAEGQGSSKHIHFKHNNQRVCSLSVSMAFHKLRVNEWSKYTTCTC